MKKMIWTSSSRNEVEIVVVGLFVFFCLFSFLWGCLILDLVAILLHETTRAF